jgi:hypothetical protein
MHCLRAQSRSTWAEDTALPRCTRSAVPGVGVDDRAGRNSGSVSLLLLPLQHQCEKPSRQDAATLRQDVSTSTH